MNSLTNNLHKKLANKIGFTFLLAFLSLNSHPLLANNTFCAGKLFLPSVSLVDNKTYAVWIKFEDNNYEVNKATLLHSSSPHLADANYTNPILQTSNVLVSDERQTLSYNAILALNNKTNPKQFALQSAVLEEESSVSNVLNHACISSFNKPQAVLINGKYHIRYELLLQDIDFQQQAISKVEIWDNQTLNKTYKADNLENLLISYNGPDSLLQNSHFAFITTEVVQVPSHLQNRIYLQAINSEETIVRHHQIEIDSSSPVAIQTPLQSGLWAFMNLGEDEHHAKFINFDNGLAVNPQRWAVDLLKLSEDGEICNGSCSANEDFFGYGSPFVAIANGVVVAVTNNIDDNLPNQLPIPDSQTPASGNSVILKLDDGHYASYSHAILGSITVNVGDQVKQGDVLGQVGNSGNSSAPHLHFHLAKVFDINNPDNSDGVPFILEEFSVLTGDGSNPTDLQQQLQELPANQSIILFSNK